MTVKTTVTMTDRTAAALRYYIGKEGLGMRAQSEGHRGRSKGLPP
jgi:hypothetical protein